MSDKNVLILHADQLRFDGLRCDGNPHALTPNLDQLAAEGTVCERHITANPVCMPSRASLLTGLYPEAHGVWGNGVALNRAEYVRHNAPIPGERVVTEPATLADVFATAGYDTVALGKLHLTPNLAPPEYGYPECWQFMRSPEVREWQGPYYGFHHVELTHGHGEQPCHGGHYGAWLSDEHPAVIEAVRRNRECVPRPVPEVPQLYPSAVPLEYHNTTWLADRFRAYLEGRGTTDRPFLAFIGFPDPHHPFTPCAEVLDRLGSAPVAPRRDPEGTGLLGSPVRQCLRRTPNRLSDAAYEQVARYTRAMIWQIDRAVGRVFEALKTAGVWDDTIIVFTSDHGDFLGDHGCLYKGYVGSDSLLHVPCILRAPGVDLPARIATPMSNTDVLPAVARFAGVPFPPEVHGEPLQAWIENPDRRVFAFCANGTPDSVNYTVYDPRHRLTWWPGADWVELFDHAEDPDEARNIAADSARRGTVEELRQAILEHLVHSHLPTVGRVSPW